MLWGKAYDPHNETPDLRGKIAVVTGGNAGTGYETVRHLASYGAKVYLVARNRQRGEDAIGKLRREGVLEKGRVELLLMDLSSMRDVKRAAEEFVAKEMKVDILVNNAAMLPNPERTLTEEGIVTTLATNHLGHFLFTSMLIPLLRRADAEPGSDVRIVNVASGSYISAPAVHKVLSLKDLDVAKETSILNSLARYGMSKMCIIWASRQLQSRLSAENPNILVMTVDPGAVATPGARASFDALPWPIPPLFWPILEHFVFPSPEVGAYPINFAATSTRVREGDWRRYKAGHLQRPNRLVSLKKNCEAMNDELAEQSWDLSQKVIDEVLEEGKITMDWTPGDG